jgi:hypothetical protein
VQSGAEELKMISWQLYKGWKEKNKEWKYRGGIRISHKVVAECGDLG